ncbi:MAG: fibronectin type III domain-containing protein, partial [Gammaproteobacteria bacterium]|nr:fibronectin type III domain-containing protein [Gammaproteobacteria bacterium]
MLKNIFRLFVLVSLAVVSACGGGGDTSPPADSGGGALSAPANVKALASTGQATVSWDAVTDATSYTVYWNIEGSPTTASDSIDAAANTQIVHSSLPKGQTYYYKVTASTATEESVLSRGASYSQSAWQWSYPLPQGNTMRDSVSNGSMIVAVGDYGAILSSIDNGVSWTAQISGTTKTLNSIVWNGSKFVTISYNGSILVSTNGIDWTAVNEESAGHAFVDIVVNGSQFIIISAGGLVHTSTNGEIWELNSFDLSVNLKSIIWTGTNYVIVGQAALDEDTFYTSTDGITWSANSTGFAQRMRGIAWDGSQYVAVGEYSDILTSPDAITWTQQ